LQITKNIDKLWIVRSQEVIKQYGEGLLQENIKDQIDKQVLETGKPVYKVVESENGKVMLRATIPYKAELYGSVNCMSCHNVKVDSVLGIVSMKFDITDGKYNAIYVIGKIFLATIVLILIIFFIANRMLKKYFKLAKQAEESLEKTYQGDFSYKIEKVFRALEDKTIKPSQGIFYNGEIFDAYKFISDLIKSSKKEIILLDNYIDETVLTLFGKNQDIKVTIYTKTITKQLKLDLQKYNAQYNNIEIKKFNNSHDRFMVIDKKEVYHI
jgi:methyl-accepting chemotaxis protein